jgi:hypothetical protein
MPGWQAQFEPLQKVGKIRIVGIVQEQHADRARLYAQWRGIDWPILVDSLNLYGNRAVPIVQFVDEAGRIVDAKLDEFVAAPPVMRAAREAIALDPGVKSFLDRDLDGAVAAFEKDTSAEGLFRCGVALRARAESKNRRPSDAQSAVVMWGNALALNPNQYIWRRRIEQYGPRLTKPYNFYGWVHEARAEIEKRGETPLSLAVEPRGAELMDRGAVVAADALPDPDPQGRIDRDAGKLVELECFATPWTAKPGERVRVRLNFRPADADWNDEGQALTATLKGPGFKVVEGQLTGSAGGAGMRTLECEIEIDATAAAGELKIPGYALYDVCVRTDGTCVFRRQEFAVTVNVKP